MSTSPQPNPNKKLNIAHAFLGINCFSLKIYMTLSNWQSTKYNIGKSTNFQCLISHVFMSEAICLIILLIFHSSYQDIHFGHLHAQARASKIAQIIQAKNGSSVIEIIQIRRKLKVVLVVQAKNAIRVVQIVWVRHLIVV